MMGKYIELKALFKIVEDYASTHPVIRDDELFALFCSVDAADVRPVVRGKWEQDELAKRLDLYVCSECGQPLQIRNADGGKTATAYCPNCGADMREESDGED